jgi:hypothetical protein
MKGAPNLCKSCTWPYLGLCYSFEGSKIGVRPYGKILPPPPVAQVTFAWMKETGKQFMMRSLIGLLAQQCELLPMTSASSAIAVSSHTVIADAE